MTLLCRLVYIVQSHAYKGLQPFLYPRCLDSDRDQNAAKNILRMGHHTLAVGITVSSGR
jgi:hypothetical protein